MTFDHVTRQSPRGCRETQHRHIRAQLPAEHANRIHQEAGFLFRVEFGKLMDLRGGSKGRFDDGAFVGEFEWQPHRTSRYQDIGENDDRVHPQDAVRLQGDLHSQLRGPADFEKIVFVAYRAVLRQVTPGLSHDPYRHPLDGFAAASAQE